MTGADILDGQYNRERRCTFKYQIAVLRRRVEGYEGVVETIGHPVAVAESS